MMDVVCGYVLGIYIIKAIRKNVHILRVVVCTLYYYQDGV